MGHEGSRLSMCGNMPPGAIAARNAWEPRLRNPRRISTGGNPEGNISSNSTKGWSTRTNETQHCAKRNPMNNGHGSVRDFGHNPVIHRDSMPSMASAGAHEACQYQHGHTCSWRTHY
jgi:hypothetical protein